MKLRHIALAPVAAIFWMPQVLPLRALSCADAIKIPYRAPTCDDQSAECGIRISYLEAFTHSVSMSRLIHSSVWNGRVDVRNVVITPTGTVESATPYSSSRDEGWKEKAAALAMTWRFVPFQREGSFVCATVPLVVIYVVPPERRPEGHISFPEINDWKSLRITLQRTACRGACPAYTLTIFGDGTVQYHGAEEESHGHVSAEAVRQLVNLFKIADFFNLFDRYGRAFDAPHFITSISFDGHSKSVLDDEGYYDGMPEIVRKVEDGIDVLAGQKVWQENQKRAPNNVGN